MENKLSCILVIDDDEPTNFISTMLIEDAQCTHHLEIADSGMKALDYIKKATDEVASEGNFIPPDLVFLDINMPRMNGWEFLSEYKKMGIEDSHKPVIIMLTTSLNPDDKQRAENTPEITDFENKPLTKEMIERIIKKFFDAA